MEITQSVCCHNCGSIRFNYRINGRHSRFIALRGKSPHHIPSRLTLSPLRYDLDHIALRGKSPHHIPSRLTLSPLRYDLDQAILPCDSRVILYIYIYLFTGFIITDECAEYSLQHYNLVPRCSLAITPRIV